MASLQDILEAWKDQYLGPGDMYFVMVLYSPRGLKARTPDGQVVEHALAFDLIGPFVEKPDTVKFANVLDQYKSPTYSIHLLQGNISDESAKIIPFFQEWATHVRYRKGG